MIMNGIWNGIHAFSQLAKLKAGLSRLRKYLPNQNFRQPCSKKYHYLFGWCLKLKTNEF